MNKSEIETIKKLKELRDNNILTQEEFERKIATIVNSGNNTNHSIEQKDDKPSRSPIYSKIFKSSGFLFFILYPIYYIYSFFHIPYCNSGKVETLLRQILQKDLLSGFSLSLDSSSETSYNKQDNVRMCQTNVNINGHSENIKYTVKNTDFGYFYVSLDDDSYGYLYYKYGLLCDNQKQVVPLLFDYMENNLNIKPVSLENHKELSYDEKTYKRQCTATLKFNDDKKETIKYNIEKSDSDNFSVYPDDDSYEHFYYKYRLLCDNQKQVVPLLFNHIEENFNIKPVSLEKYRELSYDDKTYKRQCAALLKFGNDDKVVVKYNVGKEDENNFSVSLDREYLNKNLIKQCNILAEKYAQDVISSNYQEFEDLQLEHTEFVSKNEQEKNIICKSNTNLEDFPVMYYELSQEDDEIYVSLKSPFECNRVSMILAQDIIVSNYQNFKNLKLRKPQEVEMTDDVLTCKVYTNNAKLPIMSYQLMKADDGDFAEVYVNLVADVINDAIGQIFKQQEEFFDME